MALHKLNEAKYHWNMNKLYMYDINNDISMNNFLSLVIYKITSRLGNYNNVSRLYF